MSQEQRAEYQKHYRKTYGKKRIAITVSKEEHTELTRQAKLGSISGLVKRLALERLRETPNVPPMNESTAKEALRLLRTMANNLNQVAHHVNASRLEIGPGYQPSEQMLAQMRDSVALLEKQVQTLLTPSPE